MNNITANTEYYIELDLKNHISQIQLFLTDTNPSNSNLLNFYAVKDVYINNPSGLNMLNGWKIWNINNVNTLYEIYSPKNKFYFYKKLGVDKFYMLDFTNHEDVSDVTHYSGSENFTTGTYRIYFTAKTTVATSITVNLLCYIPSLLTVKDGVYTESYN